MKNERGLTLVELLAVIVILAIIAAIAFPMVNNVINHSKADTHLANARNVLAAGKLAYASGEMPENDFEGAKTYTLQDLADLHLLDETINNPSIFSWSKNVYDAEKSLVIVDERQHPIEYKVNLSLGGENYLFNEPASLNEIKRESLTEYLQQEFNLK